MKFASRWLVVLEYSVSLLDMKLASVNTCHCISYRSHISGSYSMSHQFRFVLWVIFIAFSRWLPFVHNLFSFSWQNISKGKITTLLKITSIDNKVLWTTALKTKILIKALRVEWRKCVTHFKMSIFCNKMLVVWSLWNKENETNCELIF